MPQKTFANYTAPLLLLLTLGGAGYVYYQNVRYAELKTKTDAQISLLASTTASL